MKTEFVLERKKLSELISAEFKPGDTETRTEAHIYEKIRRGERIRCVRERKILFIFQEGIVNSREKKKLLDKVLLKRKNSIKCWLNSH